MRNIASAQSALPDSPQADAFTRQIPLPPNRRVQLRADIDYERLYFSYCVDGDDWRCLQQTFDASIPSDEATAPGNPNFTGAFVGMACQDTSGTAHLADFDYFVYCECCYGPNPCPVMLYTNTRFH